MAPPEPSFSARALQPIRGMYLTDPKRQVYICEDCRHEFGCLRNRFPAGFISYGHDELRPARRPAGEDRPGLRGHEVWFDLDRLRPESGLGATSRRVSSGPIRARVTSDPRGDPTLRAPARRLLPERDRPRPRATAPLIPVMVVWCEPPLSICRDQWLDIAKDCLPLPERNERYLFLQIQPVGGRWSRNGAPTIPRPICSAASTLPFEADIPPASVPIHRAAVDSQVG